MYTSETCRSAHGDQFNDLETSETSSSEDIDTDCARSPDEERTPRYKNILHLWEFLLELLADGSYRSMITWSRKMHGEFKLKNPEEIATKWGKLKHRPGMNYEKLSRALRHYYSKGIIRKVKGQRLVYKFHKLPYDYTPGMSRVLGTCRIKRTAINTVRQGEFSYKEPSPCRDTNLNGAERNLLDKEKMRRFFEERLNITRNDKPIYAEQDEKIISPSASPKRSSPTVVVPIPIRPSACACGCDVPVVRPIYRSPIMLPVSAYTQLVPVPYGLNYGITSIPVSVIRTNFRS